MALLSLIPRDKIPSIFILTPFRKVIVNLVNHVMEIILNKKTVAMSVILTSVLMAGCQTPAPTPDQKINANYGPSVSQAAMLSSVKKYMSQRLIDPLSATYQCDTPQKAWLVGGSGSEGNVEYGRTYYGYYSVCTINPKNRFGGYTGAKESHFMIYQNNGRSALAHFDGFQSGGPVSE